MSLWPRSVLDNLSMRKIIFSKVKKKSSVRPERQASRLSAVRLVLPRLVALVRGIRKGVMKVVRRTLFSIISSLLLFRAKDVTEDSPSPPSLSPQDLLPSIEVADEVGKAQNEASKLPAFFIPEIPPYRGGKDLEVQPSKNYSENPLAVEEAENLLISSFRALYKAALEETPPSYIKCKRRMSKKFSMGTLLSLKAELTRGDPNGSAFKEIIKLLQGETP
ncbi:hypothetical protein VNO77_46870 [Canavalia gladiata]|uniref:Uncharacterized protein n=1 Tax=Canavalia gladiata TaxID=3824 RepID=A0AAN9JFX1_CANGL